MSPPTRAYRGPQGRGAEAGALASNIRRASRPAFLRYRSGDTCGFRAYVPARGGARVVARRCGGRTSTRESRTRRLRSRARPLLPPLAVFHDASKSSVAELLERGAISVADHRNSPRDTFADAENKSCEWCEDRNGLVAYMSGLSAS